MFTDPFTKTPAGEIDKILKKLEGQAPGETFTRTGVSCLQKTLEFYPGAKYYDLTQADQHPARQLALVSGPAGTLILNGQVEPLYAFNETYPITLSGEWVEDYFRFFIAHYRGPEGKTSLIEAVDDPIWQEDPTPSSRRLLSEMIIPLKVMGVCADGGWQLSACLLIRTHLFTCIVEISPQGRVHFDKAQAIAENLPVADLTIDN